MYKRNENKMDKYDDIINLPHHVSTNHPQMPMYQRAAQFAPFAALTGHDEAIARTAESHIESFDNKVDEELHSSETAPF